jgi:hypothetical protein
MLWMAERKGWRKLRTLCPPKASWWFAKEK